MLTFRVLPGKLVLKSPRLIQVNPILPVLDMEATIAFWNLMGFDNSFDSTHYGEVPINYAVLKKDNLCIHLQSFNDLGQQYSPQIRFEVQGVDILLQQFKDVQLVAADKQLRTTPWGTKEFGLFDPNNVGITYFESIEKTLKS